MKGRTREWASCVSEWCLQNTHSSPSSLKSIPEFEDAAAKKEPEFYFKFCRTATLPDDGSRAQVEDQHAFFWQGWHSRMYLHDERTYRLGTCTTRRFLMDQVMVPSIGQHPTSS
jgi:hypothetical protein